MATPENTFIASIHRQLPEGLYWMKNHNQYVGGIADCWYSGRLGDMWVEYKFIEEPSRPSTVIDLTSGKKPILSALQQDWLEERHAEGRNVGVCVGVKRGAVWYPGISWQAPLSAPKFSAQVVERASFANTIREQTTG